MSYTEISVYATADPHHSAEVCEHICIVNHRNTGEDGLPECEWSIQVPIFCCVCHQVYIVTVEGA